MISSLMGVGLPLDRCIQWDNPDSVAILAGMLCTKLSMGNLMRSLKCWEEMLRFIISSHQNHGLLIHISEGFRVALL
jgi:hypothetical protein